MAKSVRFLRKVIISLIGFPLFVVGLILIPLPGPGILVCFVALLILSLEFEWAEKHRDKAKNTLKKIISDSQKRADKIGKKSEDNDSSASK